MACRFCGKDIGDRGFCGDSGCPPPTTGLGFLFLELERRAKYVLETKASRHVEASAALAVLALLRRWKQELPDLNRGFHKSFRQRDVCGDGYSDAAIWHLIDGNPLFWECWRGMETEFGVGEDGR